MKTISALTLAGAIALSTLGTNSVIASSEERSNSYTTTYTKTTDDQDSGLSEQQIDSEQLIESEEIVYEKAIEIVEKADEYAEVIKDRWISVLLDNGVYKSPDDRQLYELSQVELFQLLEPIIS
ncbi:Fur-regulated basic protein FbpA [Bacillus spongiae]|uniref:Fur-regulated basic protein FbpA n=1 Tax=Bacillus spongiae TaxID=2683610 RepID=A0ABU8HCI5_9BACI